MSETAIQAGFPPVGPKVPWQVASAQSPLPPSQVRLGGLLGDRMRTNVANRLLAVDEDALLHRFRERTPSSDFANAWAGEHAGKFLGAACRSLATETNDRLADKVRRIAHGLIGAQDADGYLGTYVDADRWTGWDVWVHKYVLIGLLAYYRMEGDPAALASCCAIGDRLVADFADSPAGRDVNAAGWFFGMAATSILEPVCDLYRMSGDLCYLAFAEQIVESWERRGG
ncbi:MAG: beta-L-arabinofuranosidase domain-containing protein, partial [Sphingopyxis sp.]